jgi:hypothetical protein
VAFNDNLFYLANWKKILVYSVVDDLGPGETYTQKFDKDEGFLIFPDPYTIHGLFINSEGYKEKYILVAIETSDNQIDFNTIHITKGPPKSFDY